MRGRRQSNLSPPTCRLACAHEQEELASVDGEDSDDDDSEDEDAESEGRPKDKENQAPNAASGKASSAAPRMKGGRKRKRQTAEGAQNASATRRQHIRQYYNGASHSSASAVQLFAMAMQVGSYRGENMCGIVFPWVCILVHLRATGLRATKLCKIL